MQNRKKLFLRRLLVFMLMKSKSLGLVLVHLHWNSKKCQSGIIFKEKNIFFHSSIDWNIQNQGVNIWWVCTYNIFTWRKAEGQERINTVFCAAEELKIKLSELYINSF